MPSDLAISQNKRKHRQASQYRIPVLAPFYLWSKHHWRACYQTLFHHIRKPISTLLISGIIGITMFLPCLLYIVTVNFQAINERWPQNPQIVLMLHDKVSYAEAKELAEKLKTLPGITSIKTHSPASATEEYFKGRRFEDTSLISKEPLFPSVLILNFDRKTVKPEQIRQTRQKIEKLGKAQSVHLDQVALDKFYKLLEIGERSKWIIGSILLLGVILIVGGTIRLEIQNKHNEILVIKMIGGTNAYVRRPFLYSGFWYGVLGGLLAWLLTTMVVVFLTDPVSEFAILSGGIFNLIRLDVYSASILTGSSALLGLLGSWFSVGRHLSRVEP